MSLAIHRTTSLLIYQISRQTTLLVGARLARTDSHMGNILNLVNRFSLFSTLKGLVHQHLPVGTTSLA